MESALSLKKKILFASPSILFLLIGVAVSSYGQYSAERSERKVKTEAELEDNVSLSPEKIVDLLSKEPGLMLQFKRVLVRKAFEQGRLLDPADLTDDAVFDLVRADATARSLATKEIFDRSYISLRKTKREMDEQTLRLRQERRLGRPEDDLSPDKDESDRIDANTNRQAETSGPGPKKEERQDEYESPEDRTQPRRKPKPQEPLTTDSATAVNRASLQQQDEMDGLTLTDSDVSKKLSPEELPALLAASAAKDRLADNRNPAAETPTPRQRVGAGPAWSAQRSMPEAALSSEDSRVEQQTLVRHRPNPYASVPSLYDLYSQVSKTQPKLQRFGMDIFRNGTGNFDQLPMDAPVGPEYVIGPGDSLNLELWGSTSQRITRVVDREGRIALPESGSVEVAGKSLGTVQSLVQSALRTQYRDVQADVSIGRLRTVHVYVVGDVLRAGAYDLSSLSTPLNALYMAGGPTSAGSMRILRHYRGKRLVQEVDIYDLILHGVQSDLQHLQDGDTVQVPPVSQQITIEGMVRRPAIYELRNEKSLAEALELAGGVLPTGTLRHIEIERVQAHESRTMLSLDIPEENTSAISEAVEGFKVQDGDKVRISPILPYSQKTVYLDGNVFHPGKYPYREGMKVSDLIRSYNDLLPESYGRHAEVIRLEAPDFRPVVLAFNLNDALGKTGQDLVLQPFDTVRVFSRFDFEDPPTITVTGEVRKPGARLTNGQTHLRDAIFLAGGPTPDALMSDVQVFRREGTTMRVLNANLGKAITGELSDNILLQPRDQVIVHRSRTKTDPATVRIEGQVVNPGRYPLGADMTVTELVRTAGGLKRGAFTESADLTRYSVENGRQIEGEHVEVPLGRALSGEEDTDVRLRDGDVLAIKQIAGWKDVGAAIKVEGEVLHPGTYGIKEGDRLSSILQRAGGFLPTAYPYGAILERLQVRELAEKNRQELITRIQYGQQIKISPDTTGADSAALVQASLQQQQQVLNALKVQPVSGRMVIHITKDVTAWRGTPSDIEVRPGDVLIVPKRPNFVMVSGQVYNRSAITFVPGKNVESYLRQAGGPTELANRKAIFVVRADGSVVTSNAGGFWKGSVLSAKPQPGDVIVVPEKFITGSSSLKTWLAIAQVMSSAAFAAAVAVK